MHGARPIPSIRLAAAQSISVPGEIAANVRIHLAFANTAREIGASFLVFPELSLSGYELKLLKDCRVEPTDAILAPIRESAREARMTIVVGAPVASSNTSAMCIGAIVFFADGETSLYRKQHLHLGEEKYAVPGELRCDCHKLGDESIALAVCADTAHEEHAVRASEAGASLYAAGVLWTESGYAAGAARLQQYATNHQMGVLMANHGGPSGGFDSGGRSAFWEPGGKQIVIAPETGNALLVVSRTDGEWSGESTKLSI